MAHKAKTMTVEQQLEAIDGKRKRWQSRLTRAVNAIGKLDKQRQRIVKQGKAEVTKALPPANNLVESDVPMLSAILPLNKEAQRQVTEQVTDDLAIPTFLQRKKLDPVAAEIKAEQEETKRRKAQGRIAKMKAKKSGATKAMPLTGKAALDAIRERIKKAPEGGSGAEGV